MSNDMETVTLSLETYERFKENAKLLDKMKEHPECIFTKGTMSSYNMCGISYEESFNYQGKDEVLAKMQEMLDNQKSKIKELQTSLTEFYNDFDSVSDKLDKIKNTKLTLKERLTGKINTSKETQEND